MKRLLFILLMLATSAQASITNVFHFEDFTASPQKVRQFLLYKIPPSVTNGNGGIITVDRIVRSTGTNGSVTISNMYPGSYRSELIGTTVTTTNYFVFPVTNGTINASDWMTNFIPAGVFAYSKADADARFVNISNANTVTPANPATIQSKFFSYAANGHITNGGPSAASWGPIDINTNFSARLFIGNGASLTNLPFASTTNQGQITTNQYQELIIPSMSRKSMLRTPMLGVDLWHNPDGANWSDLTASNNITIASNAGLTSLGWRYISFTDGLFGGRTNGHLGFRKPTTQAGPHAITNLLIHAAANGMNGGIYSEDGELTSAALGAGSGGSDTVPRTNSTTGEQPLVGRGIYIETDAADWAAMGVRYIQWDIHGPLSMDYRMNMARRMAAACQAVTKSNAPIIIRATSFINYDNGLVGFDPLLPKTALNSWRGSYDGGGGVIGPASWDGGWVQAVYEYAFFSRYNYTVEPGANYYFDSPSLGAITQGQQQTNQTIGQLAMWAMACSDVMLPGLYDASSPAQYRFLTNRWWLAIHQDPLVTPAHCVTSNTTWSVWARPLVDGSQAVMFLNHQTNNNTSIQMSVAWTNLGYAPSEPIQVRDVLGDSNLVGMCQVVTNTTVGFSREVTYESAALFIMSRVPVADGTIHPWPLEQVVYPNEIYFRPAPSGGIVSGPANMFVEGVAKEAANTAVDMWFFPPSWATNLTLAYGLQSDQTTSYWTNTLQEYQWDVDGARGFGSGTTFNVNGTSAQIRRFTNNFPLSTHMPMGVNMHMNVGTNATGQRYLVGPIIKTWR